MPLELGSNSHHPSMCQPGCTVRPTEAAETTWAASQVSPTITAGSTPSRHAHTHVNHRAQVKAQAGSPRRNRGCETQTGQARRRLVWAVWPGHCLESETTTKAKSCSSPTQAAAQLKNSLFPSWEQKAARKVNHTMHPNQERRPSKA